MDHKDIKMDHKPSPPGVVPGIFPEEDSSGPWIDKMEDKKTPNVDEQQRFLEEEEEDLNKDDINIISSSPKTLHPEDDAAVFSLQDKDSNLKRDLVCGLWSKKSRELHEDDRDEKRSKNEIERNDHAAGSSALLYIARRSTAESLERRKSSEELLVSSSNSNSNADEINSPSKTETKSETESEESLWSRSRIQISLQRNEEEPKSDLMTTCTTTTTENRKLVESQKTYSGDELAGSHSHSQNIKICPNDKNDHGKNNVNDNDIAEDDEKADLSRLILLLAHFETLGIMAKPKLYTKLSSEEKRLLPSFFRDIREHKELSRKVDLSQCQEPLQTQNLNNSLKEEEKVIYCKNLFLKDRKGQFFLVITKEDCLVDLKQLKNQLNASRNLSFADENALDDILGLKIREVTPLALMQQSAQNVRVIFHDSLSFVKECNAPPMAFHPFSALLQVEILFSELESFISHCGKLLEILNPEEDLLTSPQMKPSNTGGTGTASSLRKIPQGKRDKGKRKEAENNKKSLSLNNKKKEKIEGGMINLPGNRKRHEKPIIERVGIPAMNETSSSSGGSSGSSSRHSDSSKNFVKNLNLDLEKDTESSCSTPEGIRCGEDDEEVYGRENLKTEEMVADESKSKRETLIAQDSSKFSASNFNLNLVEASSEQTETPRHVEQRMKMITIGARKGKLKSYVKKKAGLLLDQGDATKQRDTSLPQNKSSNSNVFGKENATERNNESGTTEVDAEKIQTEAITSCNNDNDIFVSENKGTLKKEEYKEGIGSVFSISPKTTLPEIDEFYNFLHNFEIPYRELDMDLSTTRDIGPALGVRCFLFKDGKKNYFFIISHEFYEPDYGRLKKALRPKKYLDPCQVYELMDVLGVDSQHFTPFAVMNHRCRRNKVQVFFTEKITPPRVVLCIQHPFAGGRRLILSSSDLQNLVAHFAFSSGIGVVEEKPWPLKYNSIFSRFNARDDSNSNKKISNHHKSKEGRKDNPHNKPNIASGGGGVVLKKVSQYLKETTQSFFCNNHMIRKASNIFSHFYYYHEEHYAGMDCSRCNSNSPTFIGSPVDGQSENNNLGTEGFEGNSRQLVGTTTEVKTYDDAKMISSSEIDGNILRKEKNSSGKDHHDDTIPQSAKPLFAVDGKGDRSLLHEVLEETGGDENELDSSTINHSSIGIINDNNDKVERAWNQCEDEEIHDLLDSNFEKYNSTDSSLSPSTSMPRPMYRPHKDEKVLVETIKCHLDEHLIEYRLIDSYCHSNSNCNNTIGYSRRERERREFDNASNDNNVSQICHTQHLWAEATNTHYIVVGRDLEQIPARRFVRRFQIPNRVFVIDDGNGNSSSGISCNCNTQAAFTNPFSIFLFTHSSCKLVLHTSIYMDSKMECVFDFKHASSVSLCISSQNLEHYAQKVGMDVLYMP